MRRLGYCQGESARFGGFKQPQLPHLMTPQALAQNTTVQFSQLDSDSWYTYTAIHGIHIHILYETMKQFRQ